MSLIFLKKSFLIWLWYSTSILSPLSCANENQELATTTVGLEEFPVEICEPGEKCVKKCCPQGSFLSLENGCINETNTIRSWKPTEEGITILHGFPKSTEDDFCGDVKKEKYWLNETSGRVLYTNMEYGPSKYCIDNTYDDEIKEVSELAVICYPIIRKDNFDYWADTLHKTGICLSALSLSVILALYATSPGKNELKMQSKCIISSCFNLLVAFLLVLTNMSKQVTENISQIPCVILAIAIQFFFLSFYFWLNAMIYDITRIIRLTMNLQRMETNNLRYPLYALYAWGCPAVISIVTIVMQVESDNLGVSVIKPHIGDGRCWFKEDGGSIYAYYYGIEVFLHIINAALITYSMYLLKGQKLIQKLNLRKCDDSDRFKMRSHATKNHFDFFWQQFCTYILYICVWIMNSITLIYSREKFWRFIDIAVSLQGVFLLIIVVKFGNNLLGSTWTKLKEATKSLTTSSSNFDLTELSSQNQNPESNSSEQKFHKISEQ